jgi:hypothetical protein
MPPKSDDLAAAVELIKNEVAGYVDEALAELKVAAEIRIDAALADLAAKVGGSVEEGALDVGERLDALIQEIGRHISLRLPEGVASASVKVEPAPAADSLQA